VLRSIGMVLLAQAVCLFSVVASAKAAERYGGIEIGAKGIKTSIVEVQDDGKIVPLELAKDITNVTLSRLDGSDFKASKIDDVAFVVNGFKEAMMSRLSVPESNIMAVASSGVPSFASNYAALAQAVRNQSGLTLTRIDAREEASLTNLALIPADKRTSAMVIDIGSGNTKGGTFQDGSGTTEDFVGLDAAFGTSTFAQEVERVMGATSADPVSVSESLAKEVIGTTLEAQVRAKPVLNERKIILFSGGSVWAMMTMLKPETALERFPVVTAKDVQDYRVLMETSYPNYPQPLFNKISDEDVRSAAIADYERITGASKQPIFTPQELLAGSAILEEISRVMQFDQRSVFFDRKALTAWITAKITPPELRDRIPDALGRTLPTTVIMQGQASSPPPVVQPVPPTPPTPRDQSIVEGRVTPNQLPIERQRPEPQVIVESSPQMGLPGSSAPQLHESYGEYVEVWSQSVCCEPHYAVSCCRRRLLGWRDCCYVPQVRWFRSYVWRPACRPTACRTIVAKTEPAIPTRKSVEYVVTAKVEQPVDLASFRTWYNSSGVASQTPMKLLSIVNGQCVFEKTSGKVTSYPLDQLADSDQALLASVEKQTQGYRDVTDSTGKFVFHAALIMAGDTAALYLREDGKLKRLELEALSLADQYFVASNRNAQLPLLASVR